MCPMMMKESFNVKFKEQDKPMKHDRNVFNWRSLVLSQSSSSLHSVVFFSLPLDPPDDGPRLIFPRLPFHQGQRVNITCLSSSSKPASNLILYKNEKILTDRLNIVYDLDGTKKKNRTTIIYTIDDPDVSWDETIIRCEQIYPWIPSVKKDVKEKLRVLCLWTMEKFTFEKSFACRFR